MTNDLLVLSKSVVEYVPVVIDSFVVGGLFVFVTIHVS